MASLSAPVYRLGQLSAALAEYGIAPMGNDAGPGHVYHLYVVRVTETRPISRAELQAQFIAAGVQTGIHYPIPCHLQPAFRSLGYGPGSFPQAEALCQEILSLPLYPGMTLEQVDYVVEAMVEAVGQSSKFKIFKGLLCRPSKFACRVGTRIYPHRSFLHSSICQFSYVSDAGQTHGSAPTHMPPLRRYLSPTWAIAALLAILYGPLLVHWVDGWLNKSISIQHEYFSHGLLGLPVAAYLA